MILSQRTKITSETGRRSRFEKRHSGDRLRGHVARPRPPLHPARPQRRHRRVLAVCLCPCARNRGGLCFSARREVVPSAWLRAPPFSGMWAFLLHDGSRALTLPVSAKRSAWLSARTPAGRGPAGSTGDPLARPGPRAAGAVCDQGCAAWTEAVRVLVSLFFRHRSQRAQPFKTSWLHRGEEGRSLSFLPGPRSPEAATASRSPVAAIMSRGVSPPDCIWPGEGLVTSSLGGEDVDAPPPAPPAHRASRR